MCFVCLDIQIIISFPRIILNFNRIRTFPHPLIFLPSPQSAWFHNYLVQCLLGCILSPPGSKTTFGSLNWDHLAAVVTGLLTRIHHTADYERTAGFCVSFHFVRGTLLKGKDYPQEMENSALSTLDTRENLSSNFSCILSINANCFVNWFLIHELFFEYLSLRIQFFRSVKSSAYDCSGRMGRLYRGVLCEYRFFRWNVVTCYTLFCFCSASNFSRQHLTISPTFSYTLGLLFNPICDWNVQIQLAN